MSSSGPGLVVVFEGRRTRLHVFRRIFEPHKVYEGGREITVYSDTGVETEVTRENAEDYGLDSPLRLLNLIRLAKALSCLRQAPSSDSLPTYKIVLGRARELVNPDAKNDDWVPFDPGKTRGLDEKMAEARKRAKWSQRFKPGRSTA